MNCHSLRQRFSIFLREAIIMPHRIAIWVWGALTMGGAISLVGMAWAQDAAVPLSKETPISIELVIALLVLASTLGAISVVVRVLWAGAVDREHRVSMLEQDAVAGKMHRDDQQIHTPKSELLTREEWRETMNRIEEGQNRLLDAFIGRQGKDSAG